MELKGLFSYKNNKKKTRKMKKVEITFMDNNIITKSK